MFDGSAFQCIAHRGASSERPENTLAAFARALELGADAIELDVHLCEQELVVIHDDDLARTTNGRGRLASASLAALRTLDAGDGEQVPLLTEVLDLVGTGLIVNIELKGPGTAGPVVDLLRARGQRPDGVLLSAFDHQELIDARSAAPEFPRGALFGRLQGDPVQACTRVAATTAHLARRTVTRTLVRALDEAGFPVLVYTVNDTTDALALRDMGVAGVFTDRPGHLLAALGRG